MQCANCQFENMPGTESCARCGTKLNLAATEISIHPPRAAAWQKSLRRWFPWYRLYYQWRSLLNRGGRAAAAAIERDLHAPLPAAALSRLIIPGWAHRFLGNPERGRLFFALWCGGLWIGMTTFGSLLSGIAIGLAFATHAASILDLLMRSHQVRMRPAIVAASAALILLLAVYWPAGRLIHRFVDSRQLLQTTAPFASSDVVLFVPRTADDPLPEPGAVLVYQNVPFQTTAVARPGDRGTQLRIQGEFVDRVVAGPNTTVRWDGKVMHVDGQPTAHLPLRPEAMPADFELRVPAGCVCIFPSTNPYILRAFPGDSVTGQCIVARSALVGRAVLRHYPFWRFWWFR